MAAMDERIQRALAKERTIDITTIGRKTKKQRKIEIWFHNVDGSVYITGQPGRRSWYANLLARPEFTFHLKGSTKADLPAKATPIIDEARRGEVISKILGKGSLEFDAWMKGSPLVEVTFPEPGKPNVSH